MLFWLRNRYIKLGFSCVGESWLPLFVCVTMSLSVVCMHTIIFLYSCYKNDNQNKFLYEVLYFFVDKLIMCLSLFLLKKIKQKQR